MKNWIWLVLALMVVGCEKYPVNPVDEAETIPKLLLEHLNTDYVPTETPVDGLVTDKVNVLTFQLAVENMDLSCIEFIGVANLSGHESTSEQAIRFRTDSLLWDVTEMPIQFEKLPSLEVNTIYTFKRPVFPTNEFAPFENNQGRVESIEISEIWAFDVEGTKYRLSF